MVWYHGFHILNIANGGLSPQGNQRNNKHNDTADGDADVYFLLGYIFPIISIITTAIGATMSIAI